MSAEHRDEPFARERPPGPRLVDSIEDAMPRVARPADRFSLPVIVLASMVLGLFVFVLMSENRARPQPVRIASLPRPPAPAAALSPPPPAAPVLAAPAAAPPPPLVLPPPVARPPAVEPAPADLAQAARWKSPSMILDLSGGPNPQAAPVAPANPANPSQASSSAVGPVTQTLLPPAARPNEALTADERFAQRLGVQDTGEPARATRMTNLGATVQQGAVITAVLETAINSDLPGFARAVVSREVRSFDGATVLVPQGSHVIGQYRSGVALGQSRVFVVWTRLIRPDGVSIELGSAGTDDLGRGGLEGDVERHFFQRFGGALLLSLVGVGGQAVSDRNTQVVVNSTQAGTGAAAAAVQQEVNISPTIDVPAGTPLRIFVARDLDFSTVGEGH